LGARNGTFTLEAARRVGDLGGICAIDIEAGLVRRLERRLHRVRVANVTAAEASAHDLPFPDATFDRVFMVTVLGETPDKVRALREVRRVLKDDGQLAVGEFLPDPDYPWRKTVVRWCDQAGFNLIAANGGLLHYVLRFSKAGLNRALQDRIRTQKESPSALDGLSFMGKRCGCQGKIGPL
jgi:ubiquinone/menaquinone biosynthesis C-methylase UbiE